MKFDYKVKQTKTDLQKYNQPSFLNHHVYCAHAMLWAKKNSAKGSNFNEDESALPL